MYGWRGRVGLISPSRGDTLIYEFCKMAPDGVVPVPASLGVQHLTREHLDAVLDRYEAAVREMVYEECDVINLGGSPPVTSGRPGVEERLLERARAVRMFPCSPTSRLRWKRCERRGCRVSPWRRHTRTT